MQNTSGYIAAVRWSWLPRQFFSHSIILHETTMDTGFSIRIMLHLLLIRPLVSIFFGVNAIGVDHLSRLDQFIVISNHNSHIDTLLLYHILPPAKIANTRVVAAADYFAKRPWLYRLVSYLFDPIWLDRNKKSCSVFTEMVAHL